MTTAVSVQVCEAITTALKQFELSQEFTPVRSYADWKLELADNNTLHVDVVTVATQIETDLSARGMLRYGIYTDIAVRKRFGPDRQIDATGRIPNEYIDELVYLVEEINELFTPARIPGDGVWEGTSIQVNPYAPHLREFRQFTGIIRLQHRINKQARHGRSLD